MNSPVRIWLGMVHFFQPYRGFNRLAAINALLPQNPTAWTELNAEDYLIQYGTGKDIAVIGHFPICQNLTILCRNLWVLELEPKDGISCRCCAGDSSKSGHCRDHRNHSH